MENVTHEEAVATLKSITDKVTLVVGKTNIGVVNSNSTGTNFNPTLDDSRESSENMGLLNILNLFRFFHCRAFAFKFTFNKCRQ